MIAICWKQIPVYAAKCIGAFVDSVDEEVVVLRWPGNRFAAENAEAYTHCRIIDVTDADERSLVDILGCVPRAILSGGWGAKSFRRWMREVKGAGGLVIAATDEAFVDRSLRQFLRKWRVKILYSRMIDYFFLAGKGGVKQFVDYYGFPRSRIVTGLYAGDPNVFYDGEPLKDRPKRFIFVGHLDGNKNVLMMCEAFLRARKAHPDWELEIYGTGPLAERIPTGNGIQFHGAIQSEALGEKYRASRCFVLGSHFDQWGVVVHEAASCGCMLILSNHVGARYDFARVENAETFDPDSIEEFTRAFQRIMSKDEDALSVAQRHSVELAKAFSPRIFADNLLKMISGSCTGRV